MLRCRQTEDLELADKKFFEPGNIDIILGMGITSELLMEGLKKGASNQPIAQKTAIGRTVSGNTKNPNGSTPYSLVNTVDIIKRFWELEEVTSPHTPILSKEEEKAEQIYESTTKRLSNGRYEVIYPLREDIENLGESKQQAIKRFKRLEYKLRKNHQMSDYVQVIDNYKELGHIVPRGQPPPERPTPARPFLHTGVDYCGPINYREVLRRGTGTYKISISATAKAIHLEPVTGLIKDASSAARTRFLSRRGTPSVIYSDNGRNFGSAELRTPIFTPYGRIMGNRSRKHRIPQETSNGPGLSDTGGTPNTLPSRRTAG
ncbi:UNVERIFIED_CONTAM: hypothetical protein PYX00_000004 [Menopon gallinae]|uniref:Integrase catalytic domain-containing protein n=1 Tax=Menopon gallinae TaxID=328185 RepID=A0AAW2I9J1_9NEOP